MSKRFKVEVGDVYNEFTVLEVIEDPKRRKVRVRCSCGNEELKALHPVYHGTAKYCERCSYVKKRKDLTGSRFGRLVCIERGESEPSGHVKWKCSCDCGKEKYVSMSLLQKGEVKSCGCLYKETRGTTNLSHGMSHSAEYDVFKGVLQRCNNPNDDGYCDYGGRGIKCLFNSFEDFYEALGPRPEKATIERHDVNGHYSKDNCYWETNWSVQAFNRRSNKKRKYHLPLGVFFTKSTNTYYASVTKDGVKHTLTSFLTINDALEATKKLENDLFGFNRDRTNEQGVVYEEIRK